MAAGLSKLFKFEKNGIKVSKNLNTVFGMQRIAEPAFYYRMLTCFNNNYFRLINNKCEDLGSTLHLKFSGVTVVHNA